jgi:A/G-specific adenine glycosylase
VKGRAAPVARLLVEWFGRGHRDLPWRRTRDPYRIWVSEIMLQQTRSATVIPYYERFLERFPTVESLAAAGEHEVLALWSGLGYYSRARNLRKAAQAVVARGGFPAGYEELLGLPGIGEYTAAAVASIAFGLPHAAVDGNVLRVVARLENDASDIVAPATRRRFRLAVQGWLDARRAGEFNQALMELGATVCLPRNPLCPACPLAGWCRAREAGTAGQLPVKLRAAEPESHRIEVLIVRRGDRVLLRQRDAGAARLGGFWELPSPGDLPEAAPGEAVGEVRHTITRHRYTVVARVAHFGRSRRVGETFRWFSEAERAAVPVTTISRKCLELLPKNTAPGAGRRGRVREM